MRSTSSTQKISFLKSFCGIGDDVEMKPAPPDEITPVITPVITDPTSETELQALLACFSSTAPNAEKAKKFLTAVTSMRTTTSTQKISFLKSFCGI